MAAAADLNAIKTALVNTTAAFDGQVNEWKAVLAKEKKIMDKLVDALEKATAKKDQGAINTAKAAVEKQKKVDKKLFDKADDWGDTHRGTEQATTEIGNKLAAMVKGLEKGHAAVKELAQRLATEAVEAARAAQIESGEIPKGRERSGGESTPETRPRR